ncbi:hypothetical protein B5S29_g954 [[Candida] boidinii]|nr:hypothetical protein B5S29_g954 [[Candida] boidinii]
MINTNGGLNDNSLNTDDKNSKDFQKIKLVVPLTPSPPKFDNAKNNASSKSSSSNNVNIASAHNTASALNANDSSSSGKLAGGLNDTNNKKKDRKDNSSSSTNGRKSKKVKGPQICEIPLPSEMPIIEFHSTEKPPFSYASLIGMALLRSDERRLTLSQIYNWISSTFRYYKRGEVGWQNSIRHNLSLNRSFEKSERSKDGKGHFWKIVEGYEYQFLKNKNGKKSAANVKNAKPSNENSDKPSAKSNDTTSDQFNDNSNILSSPLSLKSRSNSMLKTKTNDRSDSKNSNNDDTAGENENSDDDDEDEDDDEDDTFHIRKNRQNKNSAESSSSSSFTYPSLSTTASAGAASGNIRISHTAGSSISSSSSATSSSSSTDITRLTSINNNPNKGDPAMLFPVRSSNLLLSTPTSIKNSFNALNNSQLNSIPENHAQLNSWSKVNSTPTTSMGSYYMSQTHLSPFQTRNSGAFSVGGTTQTGNKLQGKTTNASGVTITINGGSSEQEQRELDQSSLTSSFASFHDSPGPLYATKNIPFTSSFSCKSNFDLSPIKSSETGPLLEPLTPVYNPNSIGHMGISLTHNIGASSVSKALNNYTGSDLNSIASGKQNNSSIVSKTFGSNKNGAANKNINGIPSASNNSILPSSYYFNNNLESPSPSLNNITNRLSSKHGNSHSYQSGNTAAGASISNSANQNSYPNNNPGAYISNDINRTPLNILRTPKSDSVMKRLWNSPVSYLEDFYALSPIAVNKGSIMGNISASVTNPVNINNADSNDSNRLLPPLSSTIFGSGGNSITNKIDDFVLSENISSSTASTSLKRNDNLNNRVRKESATSSDTSSASGAVSSTGPANNSAAGLISSVDYFGSPIQNIKKRKLNTRDSIISGGTGHHSDINNGYSYDTVGSSNCKEFNDNNKRRMS